MIMPFCRPGDLRSLTLAMRGKCRDGTLTPADVARYCERIEANADEWDHEQRLKACQPLLDKLGLALTERGLTAAKQLPEVSGR